MELPHGEIIKETKVGVTVNKYRSHDNTEINTLVKKMIRNWRDAVQAEKNNKKKLAAASSSNNSPSSPSNGSSKPATSSTTTSSNSTTSTTNKAAPPAPPARTGPRNPRTDGVNTQIYENDVRNASIGALYTSLAVDREDSSQHILKLLLKLNPRYLKANI